MAHRRWKLDLYPRGVITTTGAPSYTFGSSYFRDAPTVGGQIVRPADCTVESNPWTCTIVDLGSTFTARLADSSGRLHQLGRLARLRASLDSTASSAFSSVTVGRLTDLALNPNVTSWNLQISDERWVERQTMIFTKNDTCALIPFGNISTFQGVPGIEPAKWRVINKLNNVVCLRYDGTSPVPTSPDIVQLVLNDLQNYIANSTTITAGNFRTLRFRNTGNSTTYEIAAFGFGTFGQTGGSGAYRPSYPSSPADWWNSAAVNLLDKEGVSSILERFYVWLVWVSAQPTMDTNVSGYLYAPTHEPTQDFPHFVGGSTGLQPFTLTRQIYSGTHSATTSLTVRYSTARFTALEGDRRYGLCWYQARSPEPMDTFVNERIYGPYQVAPVVDSSGKIAPQSFWLPSATALSTAAINGLPTITSTNAQTHPTWEHPSGEVINAVRVTQEQYIGYGIFQGQQPVYLLPKPSTIGSTFTHDTLTVFGQRQATLRMLAVSVNPDGYFTTGFVVTRYIGLTARIAQGLFDRYGDGPLYSEVAATSSIDATTSGVRLPGHFVKLNIGTFPNANTLARGGVRIMQITRRDVTPLGRAYRLLDVGANLTPLAAPSVSLALSTASSRHSIVATVASLPAGARYELQLARTSTGTTSKPVSTAGSWFPTFAAGTSTGLVKTIGPFGSKYKWWGRVRATKPLRIGSAWSTGSPNVVTAGIAAPSALAAGSITAGTARLTWTNGSSQYDIEVMVDASTSATLGTTQRVARLPPRTTRYDLVGLNSNDSHKAGVWHADHYAGRSAQATVIFTTTTGYTVAPALRGLVIVSAST